MSQSQQLPPPPPPPPPQKSQRLPSPTPMNNHSMMSPHQMLNPLGPPIQHGPSSHPGMQPPQPPPPSAPSAPPQGIPSPPNLSPSAAGTPSAFRPLNVKDALSYLDQVKVQFSDQPDVYNRFLDIMKDFKSQAIDTPGVIDRVSTLFRGHPSLIQGFNTFLPPGYRIECSMDPHDPNMIRVTTPTGSSYFGGSSGTYTTASNYGPSNQPVSGYNAIQPSGGGQSMASLHAAANQQSAKARAPVEFNHAINYVNKIKNRFSTEPDTYKQFLEILRTYQQEQRPIHDVYAQVTTLFKGAPDLLDEFQQFLPDTSSTGQEGLFDMGGGGGSGPFPSQGTGTRPVPHGIGNGIATLGSRLPPVGSFAPPPSIDDPYRKSGAIPGAMAGAAASSSRKKRAQVQDAKGSAKSKRSKLHHKELSPTLANREGMLQTLQPAASSEELAFFDRVKKYISNKQTYNEFLKLINLFTQDIIDHNLLVERVETFIGANRELFDWFKNFVGYDGKDQVIENEPSAIARPRLDLNTCKAYGNSYRLLPTEERTLPCAGRDDLCWEVLNDTYASHPTWASEDSGFVAHKKNIHEEALGKCEEDRYEYDINIEANQRVIELLEPIAQKIATMTADEKNRFRLEPGLGGRSVAIYQRVIKKIYDKEQGLEVIDALHNNPAVAVPIVLKRCKAKDEEWKKAKREWNKVWREIEAKNYYKALDHQGVHFKSNDKKHIACKSLITEIETLRKEGMERGGNVGSNGNRKLSKTRYQFEFLFDSQDVFKDMVRLMFSYLEKASGHSLHDSTAIETFIRTFLPLFFGLEKDIFKPIAQPQVNGTGREDEESDHVDMTEDDESMKQNNEEKKGSNEDLRKDVLKHNAENHENADKFMDKMNGEGKEEGVDHDAGSVVVKNEESINESGFLNEKVDSPKAINGVEDSSTWIQMTNANATSSMDVTTSTLPSSSSHIKRSLAMTNDNGKRQSYNFFTNNAFYCFFRLLQLVYCRLKIMRNIGMEFEKNPDKNRAPNSIAVELGVHMNRLEEVEVDTSQTNPYKQLLELCDKLFDGDIDQTTFEESVRYLYGTKSYLVFTIDKVIQAVLKQAQTIVTDTKCEELLELFRKDREVDKTTVRQQIIYRMQAESVLYKDENLYRLEWIPGKSTMTIQVLNKDDLTLDDAISIEEKWSYYIDSYVLLAPTEGVESSEIRSPFLRRNLGEDSAEEMVPPRDIMTYSGLEIKICINTYKIFFVNNTEDFFYRKRPKTSSTDITKEKRRKAWQKWIDNEPCVKENMISK